MIRASAPLSIDQALEYYQRDYTRGDYYAGDRREGAGTWQGRGAERLGLRGEVAHDDFAALLAGRSPHGGRRLVAPGTASGKHRAAWDFQVSPDKSVSIVALVGGDTRIVNAHLAAARRALEVLEDYAQVKDRKREVRPSRNLVIARFDHDSSRALDPQLHSHHVVFNLTERRPGEWRALESRGLHAAQGLATAVYHAELARSLQALGYEVHANARGHVSIAAIPEEVAGAFSKRRREILAEAARRGSSRPADLDHATLSTRPAKNRDVDPAALRESWRAEAARLGLDLAALRRGADERLAAGLTHAAGEPLAQARAAVAWAVDHLSERQASFRLLDLENHALRHGAARGPGLDDIRAACAAHPGLLRGQGDRLTTLAALRREQENLAHLRHGLHPSRPPVLARPYDPGPDSALGPDQLRVVRHVLESRQQVLGVEGKPGTGKTFTLAAVREAAEKAGWTVRGFAVTTGAVAQLREVGIDAATLKSLAAHPPEPLPRQLWIVDEASLLSNRDAGVALDSAQRAGARLVLVGDRGQHHAVEAGTPWRAFQTAGLHPAQLDLIRRQKDPDLLAAVQLSSAGRAGDALRHLDARGLVVEIAGTGERHAAMVKEFASAPDDTLLIAPSRAERRDLNFLARRELLAAGRIQPDSLPLHVEIAVSKGATSAQRADVRHYDVGDVVTYLRAAPAHGLRAGDTARVLAIDPERRTLRVERHRDGAVLEYDPRRLRGGDLARAETRELAPGDRIQFRRADRPRGIANGATATVREARASGRLVLDLDGPRSRTVTLEARSGPLPLDYAYAVTSHAAQGSTVRRVLATIDTRHSVELVNRQQAHVTLSRASHRLTVYTDDRAALPAAVDREARKATALEVQDRPGRSPDVLSPTHRAATSRQAGPNLAASCHAGADRAAAPEPTDRATHTDRGARTDPTPGIDRATRTSRAPGAGRATDPNRTAGADRTPVATAPRRAVRHAAPSRRAPFARTGPAEPGPAPRRRARDRPGRPARRAFRPLDSRPGPERLRAARPQPRDPRAEERPRRSFAAPARDVPLRRDSRPGDARDPGAARFAHQPPRPPAHPLARRLIEAAERWQQAQAGPGSEPPRGQPPAPRVRPPALRPRLFGPRRGAVPAGAAAGVAFSAARAAVRAASALAGDGDVERQLVALLKEIGVSRALALLPPPLARAVRAIREVARLLDRDLSLGR
jgi:conjugative relaxase-like TrwC/TraI family protein